MPYRYPDRHTPEQQDPRAVARERLAARARRLRTLRLRAAGGAVGVFLAAWLALFVPAQGSSSDTTTAATAAASAATEQTETGTSTDDGWVEQSYDSSTDGTWSDQATQSSADTTVQAAPATTSQS